MGVKFPELNEKKNGFKISFRFSFAEVNEYPKTNPDFRYKRFIPTSKP